MITIFERCGATSGSQTVDESMIGLWLHNYEVVSLLGKNGMGQVYPARHTYAGRRAAIKFLRPGAAPDCDASAAPRSQVYDLSGNAAEWEDSCGATTGPNDFCRARGGSFLSTPNQSRCAADFSAPRSTASRTIGFRCSSNP